MRIMSESESYESKCIDLRLRIKSLDKQTNEALSKEDFKTAAVLAKQRKALSEELHMITFYNNTDKTEGVWWLSTTIQKI